MDKSIKRIEKVEYVSPEPVNNKKGIVYTCVTNNYDTIENPLWYDENLDYLILADRKTILPSNSIWKIKYLEDIEIYEDSNRYCKMHPFELFGSYDYSIYIDGNVKIMSDVTSLYRISKKSKFGIAMHTHNMRNCSYKESEACIFANKGNKKEIKKQIANYAKEGFPREYGLFEATIIVTDLKNLKAKSIYEEWWKEYRKWNSKRDQLSFPYVLWKKGIKCNEIGYLGNDEYQNPKFLLSSHINQ